MGGPVAEEKTADSEAQQVQALEAALRGQPNAEKVLGWVKDSLKEHAKLERLYKRTKLDLATVIEATNQINAKSLDLKLIENFTLNMIMGQFATFKVLIMRRDNYRSSTIITVRSKNIKAPEVEFDEGDPVVQRLKAAGRPLYLKDLEKKFLERKEIAALVDSGVQLAVPLIKTGIDKSVDLVGLLCLGEKFGGKEMSESELRVLSLLGNMVAISLNNAQLYERSIFDSLTQVYSRGHFDLHLQQEITRAERARSEKDPAKQARANVSLLMIDIDDFKKFNDTYLHVAGDRLLKSLAHTFEENIRGGDIVARYGGEEFAAVLPETNLARAVAVAERIREKVAAMKIEVDGRNVGATVSIGVAAYPKNAGLTQELIREADKALYQAKERGKNCVQASDVVGPGMTAAEEKASAANP